MQTYSSGLPPSPAVPVPPLSHNSPSLDREDFRARCALRGDGLHTPACLEGKPDLEPTWAFQGLFLVLFPLSLQAQPGATFRQLWLLSFR